MCLHGSQTRKTASTSDTLLILRFDFGYGGWVFFNERWMVLGNWMIRTSVQTRFGIS